VPENQEAPDIVEVDFERAVSEKVRKVRGIDPRRWKRIREEIQFDDLVYSLTKETGREKISCPFHGPETVPSFHLYRGSNDGFCFGCFGQNGKGYYDHIRFVKELRGLTWYEALCWLENEYELPPLPDLLLEDEDEDEEVTVTFDDLQEAYLTKAAAEVSSTRSYDLAESYIHTYFSALNQHKNAREAAKQGEHEEAAKMRLRAAKHVAAVLGQATVDRILTSKAIKEGRR